MAALFMKIQVQSKNIPMLPGIDHLRALAAVLIVLYHGTQWLHREQRVRGHLPQIAWAVAKDPFSALIIEGHTAVALFMVLSGFIFAYGVGAHDVKYHLFLKNRFLRTYPLFLVLLVIGCCTFPHQVTLDRLALTVCLPANFNALSLPVQPFSNMFWTLSVEWQFYLLFPFLIAFMRPKIVRNAAGLILLLLFGRWLACQVGGNPVTITYLTILGRLDQFLIGVVLGQTYTRLNQRALRWSLLPAAACVLGSLFFFNRVLGGWPNPVEWKLLWITWEGLMWGGFIVCYLAVAHRLPQRLASAVAAVGTASYSIYLWHWPLVDVVARKGWYLPIVPNLHQNAFVNTVLLLLPSVLALSFLSYNLIERPFLRLRVRYLIAKDAEQPSQSS
jgi:peptidoglycan/LPS O-acetylase OafA/YrhL